MNPRTLTKGDLGPIAKLYLDHIHDEERRRVLLFSIREYLASGKEPVGLCPGMWAAVRLELDELRRNWEGR